MGFHAFGMYIHNDTLLALGRQSDQFGDTGIPLRPVIGLYLVVFIGLYLVVFIGLYLVVFIGLYLVVFIGSSERLLLLRGTQLRELLKQAPG